MSRSHGATRGHKRTPEYIVWTGILQRCLNEAAPEYRLYGGRGIRVCERWRSFASFLEDMGPRPNGLTIDRIDNDGNYEPGNCRWATQSEQARNTSTNVRLEIDGRSLTVTEWAEVAGVPRSRIYARVADGWDARRAVFEPFIGPSQKGRMGGTASAVAKRKRERVDGPLGAKESTWGLA